LHHLVTDAPWSDEELLAEVRRQILPAMKHGPILAWIVDDNGFPKRANTRPEWRAKTADDYVSRTVPGSCESVSGDFELQSSHCVQSVLAGGVGQRYRPSTSHRGSQRDSFPNQKIALDQIRQTVENVETEVTRGIVLADAG
jgi:SRSO17 transposase